MDIHQHTAFKPKIEQESEDSNVGGEKTEKTKSSLSLCDGSKRSSVDITVKMKRRDSDSGIVMYSAKQLSEIRQTTASTEWPDFLDEGFKNARGQWDPDRWHQNRKRGSTPPPGEGDKLSERRERDCYPPNSERSNITKSLSGQDRSTCLSADGNRVST